jgi:hypothetical protein
MKPGANNECVFRMPFASVYPQNHQGEKMGRTKQELHIVIHWLTGYDEKALRKVIADKTDFRTFFAKARMIPNVDKITGVICGYRVEDIEDPLMQQIRYPDKLVDELTNSAAKGEDLAEVSATASPHTASPPPPSRIPRGPRASSPPSCSVPRTT